jgi:branched-subunit amino acid transport protein AzlD
MSVFWYSVITVAICAVCTFATRVFPFAVFGRSEKPPEAVRYLGRMLPPAVMSILIVYCLRNVDFGSAAQLAPQLISIALVVLLHLWKRNNLLSIGAGTVCYMLLVQLVFS